MPSVGDKHEETGFTWKACKVCDKVQWVDCCDYCSECYPYGESTDRYKAKLESGRLDEPKCDHNYYESDTCPKCGARKAKPTALYAGK